MLSNNYYVCFKFKTLTFHRAYYVPETVLNTSQTLIYSVSITIL